MKIFFLIYDASFDDDVIEILSGCCDTGFTRWSKVLGKGERSDPKMDDAIWPGYNCAVMASVPSLVEPVFTEALQKLYKNMDSKGMKVFSWPIERII